MLGFTLQGVIFIVNSYYSLEEVKHVNIQTTGMPAASSTKSHFDLLFLLILSCPICLQSHTVLSVITILYQSFTISKNFLFLSHFYSVYNILLQCAVYCTVKTLQNPYRQNPNKSFSVYTDTK